MTVPEVVSTIREARRMLIGAIGETELPQIDAMLRNADMELHWALWNLGEPVGVRPELDYPAGLR
jgi:hypothetical protein